MKAAGLNPSVCLWLMPGLTRMARELRGLPGPPERRPGKRLAGTGLQPDHLGVVPFFRGEGFPFQVGLPGTKRGTTIFGGFPDLF